jgi:hypothetical protein
MASSAAWTSRAGQPRCRTASMIAGSRQANVHRVADWPTARRASAQRAA